MVAWQLSYTLCMEQVGGDANEANRSWHPIPQADAASVWGCQAAACPILGGTLLLQAHSNLSALDWAFIITVVYAVACSRWRT